jgi:hypothetical protein
MRGRYLALCSLLAVSVVLLGCEEEDSSTETETIQVDPPTMELVSPADGDCVAIGSDPDVRIPFELKSSWLYLRPPGYCGESVQCGHLLLWANDKIVARSSTSVIEWEMTTVINRYGEFKIRIVAVTDAGAIIPDADGNPLEVTTTITTAVSCPAEP